VSVSRPYSIQHVRERFPAVFNSALYKLYRSIATMDKKAPLPKIAAQTPTWHKAAAPCP
jgi:hypothetical protein